MRKQIGWPTAPSLGLVRERWPVTVVAIVGAGAAALAVTAGGCATAVVPEWAMHVKADDVPADAGSAAVLTRLARELRAPALHDHHLPAERIALVALQSLETGQEDDAALLLSIADYRYYEQWTRIFATARNYPRQVAMKAYVALVKDEVATYRDLSFGSHLETLSARLRGEDVPDIGLLRRLAELLRTGPVDEETFREVVRQDQADRAPVTSVETLRNHELANIFRARLRTDCKNKGSRDAAVSFLARTPLAQFQTDALECATLPVFPRACSNMADQLGDRRPMVQQKLADPNPGSRAAAAVVLGMTPNPGQLDALEERWREEREPMVRLALAYALARHGRRERVADIAAGVRPCQGEACWQAVALLQWLPNELKRDLDDGLPTKLVTDKTVPQDVRFFAVALLRDLASLHPLSAAARTALFPMTADSNRRLADMADLAISRDEGISRATVLSWLAAPSAAHRPLLARLSRVVTEADLPLLASLMPRFADEETRGDAHLAESPEALHLIEAAANVRGSAAEAYLVSWFDQYPALRVTIALHLMARGPSSRATFGHLLARGDPRVNLLVKMVSQAPDASSLLIQSLGASDPGQRLFAAQLAGVARASEGRAALESLVRFSDARYYPRDVMIRHAAASSLLWIGFAEHRRPSRPPSTLVEAM